MTALEKVDKNFIVQTQIFKEDARYYDIAEAPFRVYGVFHENGMYRRMPEAVAKSVNTGVYTLHTNTSGGRVRFITDSQYIGICAEMCDRTQASHCAFTGTAGFDLYVGTQYERTFIPPIDLKGGYESLAQFPDKEMREITIHFPLYADVKKLYVVLSEDAVIKEAAPYKNEKPIVYYGSSITQGGCASRPGMSYPAMLSRRFQYDFLNLGFSGSAMGEDSIANYIKALDMSVFVYDYDYNAAEITLLERTHERMFKIIRDANPTLPTIMMPRPKWRYGPWEQKRLEIIKRTYQNAINSGDKNVYFIENYELMALCEDDGTVDACHPNDFGFASMANAVGDVLEKILL